MRPIWVVMIGTMLGAATITPAWARGGAITFEMPETETGGKIAVSSPAFGPNGTIPVVYSSYNENRSPPLKWSAGPEKTKSYVLIVEDPDAPPALPVVHWTAWNIPSTTTALPAGVGSPASGALAAIRQGSNVHGSVGYYGPHPPEGDAAHRYFFQVYALDTTLDLPAGTSLPDLRSALRGHVVARGETVGLLKRPDHPKHP